MRYELQVHNLRMRNSAPLRPGVRAQREVHLPALVAFECVARHLSFARAAEELDVTTTAISKTIKQLEAQLEVRLFNRTTRSVALPKGGTNWLGPPAPALAKFRVPGQQGGDSPVRPPPAKAAGSAWSSGSSRAPRSPRAPSFRYSTRFCRRTSRFT